MATPDIYVVVAFVYFTSGGATTVTTLPGADDYRHHGSLIDCKTAQKAVMKNRKEVFHSICTKLPAHTGDVTITEAPKAGQSAGSSEDKWTFIVNSIYNTGIGSYIGFGTQVKKEELYPQEGELPCRRVAELLERYGEKKHEFKCDSRTVVKR